MVRDCKLLTWFSAETVGVPTYKAASANFEVLRAFFTFWTCKVMSSQTTGRYCNKPAPQKMVKMYLCIGDV